LTVQCEFFADDGDAKSYRAGTVFVRYHGRTEIAGAGDIRALEERLAAPALAAEAHARRMVEIEDARRDPPPVQQASPPRWTGVPSRVSPCG
jgi:hypothetical protein